MYHLVVNDQRPPWKFATPEDSQLHHRPFKKQFKDHVFPLDSNAILLKLKINFPVLGRFDVLTSYIKFSFLPLR